MRKIFLLGPLMVIALWFVISQLELINPILLPGPLETLGELFRLTASGLILDDLFATLSRTLGAFAIALVIGLPAGLALGKSERAYRSIEFIVDFFRSTPATAIFPLFLLLFGIGDYSKIAAAAFGAVLIIIFNTAYGVINSKKSRILAAKLMGATRWQMFKWIVSWESLPQTFVGLRNSISLTLVVIIVTEMFIGTTVGLGRMIIDSQLVYNIEAMYAAIIISGVLGYLLNYILLKSEKRLVHWIPR